jgi:ABC-2 type transport system permease protein
VSPLPRWALLTGKTLSVLGVIALQLALLTATAFALGWDPVGGVGMVLPLLLLGTAAFSGLGLLMAGTLRAEATLAAANLVYLVLLMCGGIVIPLDKFGGAADALELTPAAALATGLRDVFTGVDATPWGPLAVLAVWAALALTAAARWFRWE